MEARLTAVESKMEIRLLKRPKTRNRADQTTNERKRYFLRVCLYSDVKQGLTGKLHSNIDIEMGGKGFRRRVEAAGGALAEYQNTNYGDQHDPSHCARTARELAIDILRHVK